jgi:hypothetical protein
MADSTAANLLPMSLTQVDNERRQKWLAFTALGAIVIWIYSFSFTWL